MADIVSTEQESESNRESESDQKLLERTKRWVDERSLSLADKLKHPKLAAKLHWEKNARKIIYEKMGKDIKTNGMQNPLNSESVAQRALNIHEDPKVVSLKDTLTEGVFYQILRKEGVDIIAEERRTPEYSSDDNLISQAKIGPQGQTELTLQFTGKRFAERDANPNILHSNRFPHATIEIFDRLSGGINKSPNPQPKVSS